MTEQIAIQAVGTSGQAVHVTLHQPAGATAADGGDGHPAVLFCDAPLQAGEASRELSRAVMASLVQGQLAVATVAPPEAETIDVWIDAAVAAHDALAQRADVDASRVAVLGYAVGGVIAASLVGRREHVARVGLLSPTTSTDLTGRIARSKRAAGLVDAHWRSESMRRSLKSTSPADDLAAADHAVLIAHGAADQIVPCETSLAYLNAIEVAGRRATHVLVARGDHFFTSPPVRAACLEQLLQFFGQLRSSETQPRVRARSA